MYQYGSTPLMYAAANSHLPMVEYLVERGADIDAQDHVEEQLNTSILFLTLT